MSGKTVNAFVLSNAPNLKAYFAYSNEVSRDLIINYRHAPHGKDILGKWITAAVRDMNSVYQPVTVIEDLFETRIIGNIPEIKVEAFYDGRFEDKFNVFYNKYVGLIFDNANVFPNIERNRPYTLWIARLSEPRIHARWRISTKQSPTEPTDNLRTVTAIVHSLSMDGKRYVAWSKSEPRDKIFFDADQRGDTSNPIGRWIEVTINRRSFVVGFTQTIPDVFETRIKFGTTEVLADFEHTNISSEMFYSSYFGNICDPNQVVTQSKRNSWYRGWIVFHQKSGVESRWRLSRDQVVEGPFTIERNQNQHYHNDRRNSWDASDKRPNEIQKSDSRDVKDYDNFNVGDRDLPSSNFSSPPKTNSVQNRDNPSSYSRESYNNATQSYGSGRRNESSNNLGDNTPDRNRPINQNMSNSDNNRMPSSSQGTSSNTDQRNFPENNSINHVRSSDNAFERAAIAEPTSVSSSKPCRIAKVDRTAEETNLLKLKTDLARMSHLVQSLTKDCSVTEIMRAMNKEGYEELMDLTTSK